MADSIKNKAMIPMDCSNVVYKQSTLTGFNTTNSTIIKDIDLSTPSDIFTVAMRPFEMAGEFYIDCPATTIGYKSSPSTTIKTYSLKCRLIFDNNTTNRLQFIRFYFKPNVTFNNIGSASCKFGINIYISINNTDKQTINLVSTINTRPNSYYETGIYKFIYDIENNTIETDTYELSLDL